MARTKQPTVAVEPNTAPEPFGHDMSKHPGKLRMVRKRSAWRKSQTKRKEERRAQQ